MKQRIGLALAALLAVASLAGCATDAEIRQHDEALCRSFGFKTGTPDFAACLQRESLARRYPPPYWGPGWWPPYPHPPWY